MRVAVVVRSLKVGGMERVAVNLSEAFADAGYESHLIYFKAKNRVLTPKQSVHFHYFNLSKLLNLTIIGAILGVFAKLLSGIFRGSFFFYNGLLLAPIFKYKLNKLEKVHGKFDLIIMRGHGTFELIWPIKDERIIQMVESVFIRHGSILDNFYIKCVYDGKNLGCVSSGVKEKVLEVLSKTRVSANSVELIHNPIDIELIREKSNAYKPDINKPYIISVGRITPNKNISFLLESYKYAKNYLSLTMPLVIVGNGHDMKNVKSKIIELNLEKNVKLLGILENPYPWIKNAEILTSTSKAEGFGMVLIEALSCKTKVITTKSIGGVKDIMLDDLEKYMIDFSEEKFANKICEVIEESKVLDFDKYINRFSSQSIVKRYEKLYLD
ncbi:glycosyltransferase [Sulfurimonas sp.]|uniref:glycosyltransferase n=1 Tax=Sulfurimonas sp. TaxID=2022749 RepID=UPI0025D6F743|nr:glycosyltransferase [Sulfurimonas sp.]